MCPVSVSFAALLRFFCAFPCQEKASNAPARPLIRQAFQCGGVQPWAVQRRCGHPARPVHSRTGGEPPFTQPRGFRARFAKPSGHRPHLAGNAFRCIRGGTRRSMARVLRAGICGDEFFWGEQQMASVAVVRHKWPLLRPKNSLSSRLRELELMNARADSFWKARCQKE